MAQYNRAGTFDSLLELADGAAAVTSSAAGLVDTAAKVIDLGGAAFMKGLAVIDVSACKVSAGDEDYEIKIQGSNTAAFGGTDIVDLANLNIGDASILPGASDKTTGTYEVPFCNQSAVAGSNVIFRYLRVYAVLAGTSPSVTYTAYITKG